MWTITNFVPECKTLMFFLKKKNKADKRSLFWVELLILNFGKDRISLIKMSNSSLEYKNNVYYIRLWKHWTPIDEISNPEHLWFQTSKASTDTVRLFLPGQEQNLALYECKAGTLYSGHLGFSLDIVSM